MKSAAIIISLLMFNLGAALVKQETHKQKKHNLKKTHSIRKAANAKVAGKQVTTPKQRILTDLKTGKGGQVKADLRKEINKKHNKMKEASKKGSVWEANRAYDAMTTAAQKLGKDVLKSHKGSLGASKLSLMELEPLNLVQDKTKKTQSDESLTAETEKPKQAQLYDTILEEAFLDPKWINDNHVSDIGSGLKMHTLEKGDAKNFPERGDEVTVEFQGFLHNEDGKRYEVHRHFTKPFTFVIGLGNVIKGWDEAVKTMSLGQRSLIHVPSQMAYGPFRSGSGRVAPNSDLDFDIELLGIKKASKQFGMASDGTWAPEELAAKTIKQAKKEYKFESNAKDKLREQEELRKQFKEDVLDKMPHPTAKDFIKGHQKAMKVFDQKWLSKPLPTHGKKSLMEQEDPSSTWETKMWPKSE